MKNLNVPQIPLNKPYGVFSAALIIILHFCDSLFLEIDYSLSDLYGEGWKKKLQDENTLPKDFNFRDPQAILKEIARNGSSQFRFPLNSRISREKLSFFYNGLDDLLGERNAWVHRQLAENLSELKDLAATSTSLLSACSIEIDYISWINELSNVEELIESKGAKSSDESLSKTVQSTDEEQGEYMNNKRESELKIGSPVSSRFLSHSYVVEPNGDIADRNTGVKLSDFNSAYQKNLQVMVVSLKVGSRLRMTQEGQLCSFLDRKSTRLNSSH